MRQIPTADRARRDDTRRPREAHPRRDQRAPRDRPDRARDAQPGVPRREARLRPHAERTRRADGRARGGAGRVRVLRRGSGRGDRGRVGLRPDPRRVAGRRVPGAATSRRGISCCPRRARGPRRRRTSAGSSSAARIRTSPCGAIRSPASRPRGPSRRRLPPPRRPTIPRPPTLRPAPRRAPLLRTRNPPLLRLLRRLKLPPPTRRTHRRPRRSPARRSLRRRCPSCRSRWKSSCPSRSRRTRRSSSPASTGCGT